MALEESWDIAVPLAALLKQRGWSQTKLADAAGLKRTDVTRMLRVTNRPGDPKVLKVGRVRAQRIADALGVKPFDLGLPPEAGDREAKSSAHRLVQLEAEVEVWKELLLEALGLLGYQVNLEADPGDRVLLASAQGQSEKGRRR